MFRVNSAASPGGRGGGHRALCWSKFSTQFPAFADAIDELLVQGVAAHRGPFVHP